MLQFMQQFCQFLYVTVKELPAIMAGGSRIGDSASGNVNALAINLCSFFAVLLF